MPQLLLEMGVDRYISHLTTNCCVRGDGWLASKLRCDIEIQNIIVLLICIWYYVVVRCVDILLKLIYENSLANPHCLLITHQEYCGSW
jgi:hypothetical protein